jgi:sugar phosphate isomerase/epimerase
MLIGAMNHPQADLIKEMEWMAEMGFDFIDLTLEPPAASPWSLDIKKVKASLAHLNLKVVGHTAFYLPIAHPFESIRKAAVQELKNCIQIFSELGVSWMNIHPDRHVPFHDNKYRSERNKTSLMELLSFAKEYDMGIMIENIPDGFNKLDELADLLNPIPELGLHLDIGHANLLVESNSTFDILRRYGSRVRHVHVHDNKGGHADLHLPIGVGTIDLNACVKSLWDCGYDGTVTLEVFSPDRSYLKYSKELFENMWTSAGARQFAQAVSV